MKELKKLFIYFAMLIIFLSMSCNLFAKDNLKIVDSTNRGITIHYEPYVERIDTFRVNQTNYVKINCRRTILTGEPGEPLIPVKIINVGIPLNAEIDVNIISTKYRQMDGKLLPSPTVDRDGNSSYEPNLKLYGSSQLFPEKVLSVDNPGFVRDQRILPIIIKTMQSVANKNRISILEQIVIRIDFKGVEPNGAQNNNIKDDEFYQGLVINYSQSKNWLKRHEKKLFKKNFYAEGESWYKIEIQEQGIYKITGSDLTAEGIDISSIDPKTVRIYNNGGQELPRDISAARPDSLIENAIRVIGEDDGVFAGSDYILFYGRPVNHWEKLSESSDFYKHYINHYTNKNVYWLTWGNGKSGKRMENKPSLSDPNLDANYSFFERYFDEDEIVYQEIALYKVPTEAFANGDAVETLIRKHNARILTIEPEYIVVEKTGHKEETRQLFRDLEPYGIKQFARSGRIALTKQIKEISSYLKEIDSHHQATAGDVVTY